MKCHVMLHCLPKYPFKGPSILGVDVPDIS